MEIIRTAKAEDLGSIQNFLRENKLRPSIEINEHSIYLCLEINDQIIGTIGAELNQQYALIRAAGVLQDYRKRGIARNLFETLLIKLEQMGVNHLYLFSRQAAGFWTSMGFRKCEIQDIIAVLSNTPQVKEFLADNSIWTDVAWFRKLN